MNNNGQNDNRTGKKRLDSFLEELQKKLPDIYLKFSEAIEQIKQFNIDSRISLNNFLTNFDISTEKTLLNIISKYYPTNSCHYTLAPNIESATKGGKIIYKPAIEHLSLAIDHLFVEVEKDLDIYEETQTFFDKIGFSESDWIQIKRDSIKQRNINNIIRTPTKTFFVINIFFNYITL